MFNVVYALGELAVMYPVFRWFLHLFNSFHRSILGFCNGLELCLPMGYRLTSRVNSFWVAIILINIFGTLGYAEEEFWSSCLKLVTIVVFMIIALILVLGGGRSGDLVDMEPKRYPMCYRA